MAVTVSALVVLLVLIRLASPRPPETVSQSELVRRDGRVFKTTADKPFTGLMLERYPDGTPRSRATFKDGLMDGVCEGWHTNGALQIREHFRAGVSDGLRVKWHPDGSKQSEAPIVGGKIHGVFRAWHENGQPAEELSVVNGEPKGEARGWYPSGYLKFARFTNEAGRLETKHWADGEQREWPPKPSANP